MEKRIGSILILIYIKENIDRLNGILGQFSENIIARQGIPLREKGVNVISLVIEGTNNEISSLSGQLGRLKGITVKTVYAKIDENKIENRK